MIFENLRSAKKQTLVVYGMSLTEGGSWAIAVRIWFETLYLGLVTFLSSGGLGKHPSTAGSLEISWPGIRTFLEKARRDLAAAPLLTAYGQA